MKISMMMAMDRNKLIGAAGGMPWHIPSELAYFKSTTLGKPIIMGRVTWQSLGRALPGRLNIVVSRNAQLAVDGASRVDSLNQAFELARSEEAEEMMVIGGASLCQLAMPHVERLYLTVIDHQFSGGDTWLDSYHPEQWSEISRREQDETSSGGYRYACLVLERAPQSTA